MRKKTSRIVSIFILIALVIPLFARAVNAQTPDTTGNKIDEFTTFFTYKGQTDTYTIPQTGEYIIELYGARGGWCSNY